MLNDDVVKKKNTKSLSIETTRVNWGLFYVSAIKLMPKYWNIKYLTQVDL
jgi:hypothetical protein